MGHPRIKTFAVFTALLAWIFLLIFSRGLRDTLLSGPAGFFSASKILLLYLSIPVFFIWITFGIVSGLASLFITYLILAVFFEKGIYTLPVCCLAVTSLIAYGLHRVFEKNAERLRLESENLDEKMNLLANEIKSGENDIFRMKNSLARVTRLKKIIEDYSLALSGEEVLDSIVGNCFGLFEEANRALLYLVDTEKQELKLVRSKRRDAFSPIKAKKGDVFDHWVLRHRRPLLVADIYKDFKFSLKQEELGEGFNSLVSTPLTSKDKIMGLLRVDSRKKDRFTQSDLRFLDIIADLSSVSLENAILYDKVQDLAIHDSLTGLYVHRYFHERLRDEVKSSLRNKIDISLLMLDLDDFKLYNDRYGHSAGDLVLKHISSILKNFAEPYDIISRYGGEEFALLLLNKNKQSAVKVAESIRRSISGAPLVLRRARAEITVSIGVASCPAEAKTSEEFLMLADSRLYKAKESGKNRVWAR